MAMFASAASNNRNSNSQSSFYVNNHQSRRRGRNNAKKGRGGRFNNNNQYSQNQYPQSNTFNLGNSQFPQKPEGSRPQCQICDKLGHQAFGCYHRMDFAYQGRHPPAKLAAMASTSNCSQGGDTWLTDTGTTYHLTANLNNLQVQAPYKGTEQVSVDNGQSIPINNIGNGRYALNFTTLDSKICCIHLESHPTYFICINSTKITIAHVTLTITSSLFRIYLRGRFYTRV